MQTPRSGWNRGETLREGRRLLNSKSRKRANIGRMKAENNVFARNPRGDQFLGNRARRTVVLYPHFAVDDVDVNDRTMNAADAVPADMHELIMIVLLVRDGLRVNLSVRRFIAG